MKLRLQYPHLGYTQSSLARQLHITRASVNAWEMGISTPSTQYIIQLAQIFNVSTDFLLGLKSTSTINVNGLNEEDIVLLQGIIEHLRKKEDNPTSV